MQNGTALNSNSAWMSLLMVMFSAAIILISAEVMAPSNALASDEQRHLQRKDLADGSIMFLPPLITAETATVILVGGLGMPSSPADMRRLIPPGRAIGAVWIFDWWKCRLESIARTQSFPFLGCHSEFASEPEASSGKL